MWVEGLKWWAILPFYTTVTILDVCKGEGVFYFMFEVTVSMLPLYTEPLRAYNVDLLNAHVVCNLVDLSKYQHNWASLDLDLRVCVHWLSTEQTCLTYEGKLNILDFPPPLTLSTSHISCFKMLIFDTGSL